MLLLGVMEKIHTKNIKYLTNLVNSGVIKDIPNKGIKISFFKSGGGNHLYLIQTSKRNYLARVNYYPLKNEWKIKEHEFKVLKLLKPLKIAPKAYYVDASGKNVDQHFIITDFIEGTTIKSMNKRLALDLATVLKKLHTIKFANSGNTIPPRDPIPYKLEIFNEFANGEDKQIEQYSDWPGIEKIIPEFNRIKALLATSVVTDKSFDNCTEFSLCHADLKLENIMKTKNGVQLIDWECAGSDVPETDIGRLFSGAQFTPELENIFLEKYYHPRPNQSNIDRIQTIRKILDFFRIIEDFIILKRKVWDSNAMLNELHKYEQKYFKFFYMKEKMLS